MIASHSKEPKPTLTFRSPTQDNLYPGVTQPQIPMLRYFGTRFSGTSYVARMSIRKVILIIPTTLVLGLMLCTPHRNDFAFQWSSGILVVSVVSIWEHSEIHSIASSNSQIILIINTYKTDHGCPGQSTLRKKSKGLNLSQEIVEYNNCYKMDWF